MTRTTGAALDAHLASHVTTLSRCLRLDLTDGTSIGITDHDEDLSVNLGDGALTYEASTGVLPSAVSLSIGLEADNFEARGPLSALVTQAAVLGGRFDRATARLFDVKWDSPAIFMRILRGNVSQARIEGGEFVLEVRSVADAFNQSIGRVLSPVCTHDLGDARCQADMTGRVYTAVVTAVTNDLAFTVSFDSPVPVDQADLVGGKLTFASGALAGTKPREVFSIGAGAVVLFAPTVEAPQIGDALTVEEGCDKLRATCRDRFDNAINFGGFPDAPGSSQYLKFAVPGSST